MTTRPAAAALEPNDLLERYQLESTLQEVERLLRRPSSTVAHVLRDFRTQPITDATQKNIRHTLDQFLAGIGALQVVAIGVGHSLVLPDRLINRCVAVLCHEHVRRYYEEYYSTALPTVWRQLNNDEMRGFERKVNAEVTRDTEDRDVLEYLIAFIELDARLSRGNALPLFLDLLDGFSFDGFSAEDLRALLLDPAAATKIVTSKLSRDRTRRHALEGVDQFLAFCVDLRRLLDRLAKRRLLRGGIWLNFCYWFGSGGDAVRQTAHRIQSAILSWIDDPAEPNFRSPSGLIERSKVIDGKRTRKTIRQASEAAVNQSANVMVSLTDWWKYAGPVVTAAKPALDHWASKQSHTSTN